MGQIEILPLTEPFFDEVVNISERSLYEKISGKLLHEFLRYDYNVFYVAYDKRKSCVVGFVGAAYTFDEGELLYIAVEPDCKRQGIGQKLLSRVFEDMKVRHVNRLLLEVRENNQGARKFYEKNDFCVLTIRKNYYSEPEEDGIVMEKLISRN